MLYCLRLIYPALFIFQLGFRTNQQQQLTIYLLIPLNFQIMQWFVVCFLLGNSPASEFYMPTFRNTLPVPSK